MIMKFQMPVQLISILRTWVKVSIMIELMTGTLIDQMEKHVAAFVHGGTNG